MIRFAEFEITSAGELLRGGEPVRLQPQPMKVLALLASRAGELVTRDEIRRHVWGAETYVDFEQGLNWSVRQIRVALGDDAAAPRFVQTLPRRGYRFVAAVETHPGAGAPPLLSRLLRQPRARHAAAAAAALLLLAGTAAASRHWSTPAPVTVLVLPFEDLGGEGSAQAGRVATTEITHGLARLAPARLGVVDPPTARKLAATGECIRVLGGRVGAEYVLVGAVRARDRRTRMVAQLFRVDDNRQVWTAEQETAAGHDPTGAYAAMARQVAETVGLSPADAQPGA